MTRDIALRPFAAVRTKPRSLGAKLSSDNASRILPPVTLPSVCGAYTYAKGRLLRDNAPVEVRHG